MMISMFNEEEMRVVWLRTSELVEAFKRVLAKHGFECTPVSLGDNGTAGLLVALLIERLLSSALSTPIVRPDDEAELPAPENAVVVLDAVLSTFHRDVLESSWRLGGDAALFEFIIQAQRRAGLLA